MHVKCLLESVTYISCSISLKQKRVGVFSIGHEGFDTGLRHCKKMYLLHWLRLRELSSSTVAGKVCLAPFPKCFLHHILMWQTRVSLLVPFNHLLKVYSRHWMSGQNKNSAGRGRAGKRRANKQVGQTDRGAP